MTQLIIVFLIVLLGVLGVEVLQRILSSHLKVEAPKEPCKVHDWYSVEDEIGTDLGLLCNQCGKSPRQIQEEMEND